MVTGLTPLLDSLRAAGYVLWDVDYRSGTFYDGLNNISVTPDANFGLKRDGLDCRYAAGATTLSTPNQTVNNITELTMLSYFKPCLTTSSTGIRILSMDSGNTKLNPNSSGVIRGDVSATGGVCTASGGASHIVNGKKCFGGFSWRENNATGMQRYVDGAAFGANVDTTGKTAFSLAGLPFAVRMGAGSQYDCYRNMIIKKWLTTAEHATIYDEIVNQMVFETQDCFWPVSTTVYWRGAYGALARETAMAAGRSIGDINELVVASGTHKMSTERLDGILTKCLVCVTNGTINLPAYNLGANYVFEKFTASTGLWTTVTQASRAVALLAGDKILWANQTGNRHIKRIY